MTHPLLISEPRTQLTAVPIEIDPIFGIYHLAVPARTTPEVPERSARNLEARLTYTRGGHGRILDLILGAQLTQDRMVMGGGLRDQWTAVTSDGLVQAALTVSHEEGTAIFHIGARIELLEDEAGVVLESVILYQGRLEDSFLAPAGPQGCRFWRNWHDIWFPIGSAPLNGQGQTGDVDSLKAYHYGALYAPEGAITFGYQLPNLWLDSIDCTDDGTLTASDKIGAALTREEPLFTDQLSVSLGPKFTDALPELHGEERGRRAVAQAKTNFGWNSWEAYQLNVTAEDVLENAREVAKLPWLKERIRYITVDDGWQQNRTDWIPNEKFPLGMDGLARQIRELGFVPGIWTGPFLVSRESDLPQRHPEWLLREGDELLERNGIHYLDPTHPGARAHIASIYERLYAWGYRYYKTDFLVEAPMFFVPGRPDYRPDARCYDPNLGIMRGMRLTMEAMRAAMGEDSFWLGCGTDIGCGAGLMDASRTGGDIAPYWTRVPNQARSVIHHFHLHGPAFLADPDFLLLKGIETVWPGTLDVPAQSPEPYVADAWSGGRCFDLEDVRTWAALVILSGGVVNLSDKLKNLNEAAHEILHTVLAFAGGKAGVPLDLDTPIPRVVLREEENYCLLGLLNWDDAESVTVSASRALGVPFPASGTVRDVWTGAPVHVAGGTYAETLAPHHSRLLVWEKAN